MKKHLLFLLFIAFSQWSVATTFTANSSGNWNSSATWSPAGVPGASDVVIINGLYTVTVTGNQSCQALTITGALGVLTINNGVTLAVSGDFTQYVDDVLDISTVNVNGTLTVGGNLNMNYTYLLAITSSNTFNVGTSSLSGTLTIAGNLQFSSSTTVALSVRNKLNLYQGIVNVNGNISYSSTGSGAGVQAFVSNDDGSYDNKTKRVNIKGAFVNLASSSFTLTDANANAPFTVNYSGTAEQTLVSTNIIYRFLEISNPAGVVLTANFPNASLLKDLTIKSGGLLNVKSYNIDAINRYANQIIIENNGTLRVENSGGVPAQKVSGSFVCFANTSGIIEFYTSGSLNTLSEQFYYPIVKLTGSGTKTLSDNIDNSSIKVNQIDLDAGTFEVPSGRSVQLTTALSKLIQVASGTNVKIMGDFSSLDAKFSIHYNSIFYYLENGTQTFYSFKNTLNNVEPYGSVVLVRDNGNGNLARNILAGEVVKIRGKLDIQGSKTQVNINQNAILELSSDSQYTGWIAEIPSGADINYLGSPKGKVVTRKYIAYTDANYRDFASPIKDITLASFKNAGMLLTGFAGSDYPNYNFVNAYQYDETNLQTLNDGWMGASNTSNGITTTDQNKIIRGGWRIYSGSSSGLSYTLSDTGEVNVGDLVYNLSFTHGTNNRTLDDGWNFLGNHYPSALSWSSIYNDPSNSSSFGANGIQSSIYVWKPSDNGVPNDADGSYGFFNAATGIGNNLTNVIPTNQGFWLKTFHASANSTNWDLRIKESNKTDQAATTFYKGNPIDYNKFKVTVSIEKNGEKDKIWFHPFPEAKVGFDAMFDVQRFGEGPTGLSVNFTDSGKSLNLWVNAIPDLANKIVLPLEVHIPGPGEFKMIFTNVLNFVSMYGCMNVLDQQTGISYALTSDTTLVFSETEEYRGIRFIVHAVRDIQNEITYTDATCFDFEDGRLNIDLNGYSSTIDFDLYKNEEVFRSFVGDDLIIDSPLGAGEYKLVNNAGQISCSSNEFQFVVSSLPEIIAKFAAPDSWVPNSFVPIANQSTGGHGFEWLFSDNNTVVSAQTPLYYFETPGIYDILLKVSNTAGCQKSYSKSIDILNTTGISAQTNQGLSVFVKDGNIQILASNELITACEIYSLDGRLLLKEEVNEQGKYNLIFAPTGSMVIVKVFTKEGFSTWKLNY